MEKIEISAFPAAKVRIFDETTKNLICKKNINNLLFGRNMQVV